MALNSRVVYPLERNEQRRSVNKRVKLKNLLKAAARRYCRLGREALAIPLSERIRDSLASRYSHQRLANQRLSRLQVT